MKRIQIELITTFGVFKGDIRNITDSNLEDFKFISKKYFESGLELDLEDGSFAVFSPEVIKNSIFKINIKNV